jgi:hypothetical protein
MNSAFKEIDPLPAKRLKELMKTYKKRAVDIHRTTGISEKHISNIVTLNKPMTRQTAEKILTAFPGVRLAWLLGYSDRMTEEAVFRAEFSSMIEELNSGAKTQKTIQDSFRLLLSLYGFPLEGPINWNGTLITPIELDFLADKLFMSIGPELDLIAKIKGKA